MAMLGRILMILLILSAAVPSLAAEAGHWQTIAVEIGKQLQLVRSLAEQSKPQDAKRAITSAYFDGFENSKLEAAIRKEIGAKPAAERERRFSDLRKAVNAGDLKRVAGICQTLADEIAADAKQLDLAKVPPEVFAVNQ
jgi:hypothetical protein